MKTPKPPKHFPQRHRLPCLAVGLALALTGCAGPQTQVTLLTSENHIKAPELQDKGLAFITSSSITGQEQDKQAMAMNFANVMQRTRPQMRIISQADTLSAINRAGLSNDYRKMLEDYAVTGILNRQALQDVARVTGVRYVAQLKLSGFKQEAKGRWSALGVRLVETHLTVLRLFLQIWDSEDGSIVWEGGSELTSAHDAMSESTVTFKSAIEEAAQSLVARLPSAVASPSSSPPAAASPASASAPR